MSVHNDIVRNITVGHHENLLEDHAKKPELVCSGEHEAFSNAVPVRCSPPIVLEPLKPSHYRVFHEPEGNYLYIDRGVELQVAVHHPGPGLDCAVTMRFESKRHQKIPVQTNCSDHLPPTLADNNMVDLRTPHKAAFVLLVGDDRQVHHDFAYRHPVTTVALNAGAAKDVFSIVFPCYSSCKSFWKCGKLTVLHLNICHPRTGRIVSSSKYTVRVAANVMARALMMYQKEMLKTCVSAREQQQIVQANDGRHDNTGKTVAGIGQQGDDGRDNAGQPSAKRRKQDHTSEEDEEEISLITEFLQGFPTAERDALIRMSTPPENNGNLITGTADLSDTSHWVNEFQAEWNKNCDPIKIQMGNSTLYTDNKLVGAVGSSSHQVVNNPNTMAGPVGSSSHQVENNPNTMAGPVGSSSHQVVNNPNTVTTVGSSSHQVQNNPNTMAGPVGSSSHQVVNNPNTMVGPVGSSYRVVNNPNTMAGPVGSSYRVVNNPNTMAGPVGSSYRVVNNPNTMAGPVGSSYRVVNNPNTMAGPVGSSYRVVNNPNTMVGPVGSSLHQVVNNPNAVAGPMESSLHLVVNNPNTMTGPVVSSSHQVVNNPNTMTTVVSSSHQVVNNPNTMTTVVSSSHQVVNNPNSSGQRFIVSDEIVFVVKGLQNREEDCHLIEQFIKSRGASCFQSPLIKPVLD